MSGFRNRQDAGIRLAAKVAALELNEVVIIGLPRGGIPVAAEVARRLSAPLDVVVVRKLGVPGNPELAMGAISEEGVVVFNDEVLEQAGVDTFELQSAIGVERRNLLDRVDFIRSNVKQLDLNHKTAVIVDDGIATGATARAACRTVRLRGATQVWLAMPVAPKGWQGRLRDDSDGFVSVIESSDFSAVGQFYEDFHPVTETEMLGCFDVRT